MHRDKDKDDCRFLVGNHVCEKAVEPHLQRAEKTKLTAYHLYPGKISLHMKEKRAFFSQRNTKPEIISHQQTHATQNVQGSLSRRNGARWKCESTPVVLRWGQFCSSPALETFFVVTWGGRMVEGHWHLVGRGQGCY